jgi:hypothetical protein
VPGIVLKPLNKQVRDHCSGNASKQRFHIIIFRIFTPSFQPVGMQAG